MSHNFENLKAHILPLSVSDDFDTARHEWNLIGVELHDDWEICPCGTEIKELCHIENWETGHTTHVGNVCINRFLGIETGNLFQGLKRIAANPTANANTHLIEYAHRFGYIYSNEYRFLVSTRRKRRLSAKQAAWKEKINRRIINRTVVAKNCVT